MSYSYPCFKPHRQLPDPRFFLPAVFIFMLIFFSLFKGCARAEASASWKITAYCACHKCCGKSDGITASGKKAQYGYCAINWLPFGTRLNIQGLGIFTVMDRGARSQFGAINNHIKHIDIYMPKHKDALNFGVQYRKVAIK